MKLRERIHHLAPTVPTASMADIAFLLIIFFMLTTSFSQERTSVQLPESIIRTEVAAEAAIIAITQDGTIVFTSGEEPSRVLTGGAQELGMLTSELLVLIPEKEFVIKADREVPFRAVDEVLEELRNNGARRIGLLTRQEFHLP